MQTVVATKRTHAQQTQKATTKNNKKDKQTSNNNYYYQTPKTSKSKQTHAQHQASASTQTATKQKHNKMYKHDKTRQIKNGQMICFFALACSFCVLWCAFVLFVEDPFTLLGRDCNRDCNRSGHKHGGHNPPSMRKGNIVYCLI